MGNQFSWEIRYRRQVISNDAIDPLPSEYASLSNKVLIRNTLGGGEYIFKRDPMCNKYWGKVDKTQENSDRYEVICLILTR